MVVPIGGALFPSSAHCSLMYESRLMARACPDPESPVMPLQRAIKRLRLWPIDRLRWPLPALLAWMLAWALLWLLRGLGVMEALAFVFASIAGAMLALTVVGRFRRVLVAGGFPLSALALDGAAGLPAWAWLAALAPLLLAYPMRAWRDAPFFPTPADALAGLDEVIDLPPGARIVDAGCGLGHGLHALHRLWPQASFAGVEWSAPLRLLAARRCPWAAVRRADMWVESWTGFDLVYLFQRPESMPRAVHKAQSEMRRGTWLVSLEFEATGLRPQARLALPGQRVVWVYRMSGREPGEQAR
jgi:hypothetical protein